MRGRTHRAPEEANVDLTPMLDVVFILLIFFIVTSTFAQEETIGVELRRRRLVKHAHQSALFHVISWRISIRGQVPLYYCATQRCIFEKRRHNLKQN